MFIAVALALTSTTDGHRGAVLDEPLPLGGGQHVSKPFQTHVDGDHWIRLSGENLNDDQRRCLLGARPEGRRDCAGVPEVVSVRWMIETGRLEVKSGRAGGRRGGLWGDGRRVGQFDADAGETYVLTVTGETAAPARRVVGGDRESTPVAAATLRVEVRESPDLLEGRLVWEAFQRVGAGLFAIVGLILVAVGLYGRKRSRGRDGGTRG